MLARVPHDCHRLTLVSPVGKDAIGEVPAGTSEHSRAYAANTTYSTFCSDSMTRSYLQSPANGNSWSWGINAWATSLARSLV